MMLAFLLFAALLFADGPAAKPEPPTPPDEIVARPESPMPPDEAEVIAKEEAAALKKKMEAEAAAIKAQNDRLLQRRQMVAGMRSNGWVMPANPPGASRRERFLFLLPQAPLVTEISITIDGKPYWAYREGMIDQLLRGDPKVDGGRVAWLSIVKNPRAGNGRFASFQANETFLKQQAQLFDTNGDGFADREEAQVFFAQSFNGPAMTVMNYPVQQPLIPVAKLLDTNDDGKLSTAELDAAPARLASRDADDNELLEATEISGINPYAPGAAQQFQQPQQRTPLIVSIDDGFDPQPVLRLLASRYGKDNKLPADAFPRLPGLFASLDANSDGELQAEELRALEHFPPHLVLEVNLGQTGLLPAGLTVRQIAPELKAKIPAESGERVALEIPGMKVQLIGASPQFAYNYDSQVQSLLTALDTDKNGYIEKKEVESQPGYIQQFAQWDANDDGKVYADELKSFYERIQAPMLHTVSLGSSELGNSLWEAIDSNSDGQISVRERMAAPARLKALDADRDGQVATSEILPTIRLAVARGQYAYQYVANQQIGYRPPNPAAAPLPGPGWFHRMDRNSDGDVTRREFLGSEEQFRSLDANSDGILELKEVGGEMK